MQSPAGMSPFQVLTKILVLEIHDNFVAYCLGGCSSASVTAHDMTNITFSHLEALSAFNFLLSMALLL